MHLRSFVMIACTLSIALAATSGAAAAPPQETGGAKPPEPQTNPAEPQGKTDEKPAAAAQHPETAKPKGTPLSDRLEVRVGSAWVQIRGGTRGTTETFDAKSFLNLQQTSEEDFGKESGAGTQIDISYKILPRLKAYFGYLTSSPTGDTFSDNRRIANFSGPGDFYLAQFQSTAAPDFRQFKLGGAYRALPTKKHGPARAYVDLLVEFQMTSANYGFEAGVLTRNPFDPNTLSDPVFQAGSNHPASYDLNFLNLGGGFRIGAEISKRFSTEVAFRAYVLGRYDGTGDLASHGLAFIHSSLHQDPAFHVPGCGGAVPCGLVDADLEAHSLKVEQSSSHSRGLDASVSFDYKVTDWFGVAAGLRRSFVRSVGGEEKRILGGPSTCDIAGKKLPLPAGKILSECGTLDKAELIADSFSLIGRFRFF